jgi:hypothetical protein
LRSVLDEQAPVRNAGEVDEDDTTMAGAMVMCFVYNNIDQTNIESLLRSFSPVATDSLKSQRIVDEYARVRSKRQHGVIEIVNHTVGAIIARWAEDHPDDVFDRLSESERG